MSVKDADKDNIVPAVEKLVELGFSIIATGGTADASCSRRDCRSRRSTRSRRAGPHIVDRLLDGDVASGVQHHRGLAVAEGQPFDPRDGADRKVPYFTTAAASLAAARSIEAVRGHALEVASLQSYYSASES